MYAIFLLSMWIIGKRKFPKCGIAAVVMETNRKENNLYVMLRLNPRLHNYQTIFCLLKLFYIHQKKFWGLHIALGAQLALGGVFTQWN